MSRRRAERPAGTMLELWRPPNDAGEPIGCLATTYTFAPGLFDEQCLARFLEIGSEPSREDLAFLLERESRLGGAYAGVLVDHSQAGVEHSLRWDVLPVRIPQGKQHAKLSLLAWSRYVRIIVASANLTEPGYRYNFEVAGTIDLSPGAADREGLAQAIAFLRSLLSYVSGADRELPEVRRASDFLDQVERLTEEWRKPKGRYTVESRLAFTLPPTDSSPARSALNEAIAACRRRGGSPQEAWVASPFFDPDEESNAAASSLCKLLARGTRRRLRLCVPDVRDGSTPAVPRLAAPRSLATTPKRYGTEVRVEMLPSHDAAEKDPRPWHAKMLWLRTDAYAALLIGSSNFTRAGLGIGTRRNAEANLLTRVERAEYGRQAGQLEAVWPETVPVQDPDAAEWLGPEPERDEEEQATAASVPSGFLAATYLAGDQRRIVLHLDPERLPAAWTVQACGHVSREVLTSDEWGTHGASSLVEIEWEPAEPPVKLLVRWDELEGFLPLNVENADALPPPTRLEHMSADDMLAILAAADPSAATRAWVARQRDSRSDDVDLDQAVDLDPLRRYDLGETFLHRIRHRARLFAHVRRSLERPAWSRQLVESRLRGFIGVKPLADRMVAGLTQANGHADEELLALSDLLIVLREVRYTSQKGMLTAAAFDAVFRPFLRELTDELEERVTAVANDLSADTLAFWKDVVQRCRA